MGKGGTMPRSEALVRALLVYACSSNTELADKYGFAEMMVQDAIAKMFNVSVEQVIKDSAKHIAGNF